VVCVAAVYFVVLVMYVGKRGTGSKRRRCPVVFGVAFGEKIKPCTNQA